MPSKRKWFEILGYGALVLDLGSGLAASRGGQDAILGIAALLLGAALIWLAAHRAQLWAAWFVVLYALSQIVTVVAEFWAGSPAWLRNIIAADGAPSTAEQALSVMSMVLIVAAVGCYFFDAAERKPPMAGRT